MKSVLIFAFISSLLFFCDTVTALTCYSCIGCNEPFTASSNLQITCQSTQFYCYKFSGTPVSYTSVNKGCMAQCTSGSYTMANVQGTIQCCDKDNCNHGNSLMKSTTTMSVILGLVIIMFI